MAIRATTTTTKVRESGAREQTKRKMRVAILMVKSDSRLYSPVIGYERVELDALL